MSTTVSLEIKSKGEVVGMLEYDAPENLSEGMDMDGEEKVFKLYAQQRKITAMNNKRRELTGGGVPKALLSALKDADPEVLQKIAAEMGLEL